MCCAIRDAPPTSAWSQWLHLTLGLAWLSLTMGTCSHSSPGRVEHNFLLWWFGLPSLQVLTNTRRRRWSADLECGAHRMLTHSLKAMLSGPSIARAYPVSMKCGPGTSSGFVGAAGGPCTPPLPAAAPFGLESAISGELEKKALRFVSNSDLPEAHPSGCTFSVAWAD